jgi:hypothetical protein
LRAAHLVAGSRRRSEPAGPLSSHRARAAGALGLADPLIDRQATLEDVRAACDLVEDLRLTHPQLAGVMDDVIVLLVKVHPPLIAREHAAIIAREVIRRRTGGAP